VPDGYLHRHAATCDFCKYRQPGCFRGYSGCFQKNQKQRRWSSFKTMGAHSEADYGIAFNFKCKRKAKKVENKQKGTHSFRHCGMQSKPTIRRMSSSGSVFKHRRVVWYIALCHPGSSWPSVSQVCHASSFIQLVVSATETQSGIPNDGRFKNFREYMPASTSFN